MNIYSSELSKLVANSMLAQRISSINSISAICEATGADVDEVAKSIGLDARIGDKYLKAGLGFGGSCFKKDILSLCYLADSLGLDEVSEYWEQVLKINEFQRSRFVRRVVRCMNYTLVGKKLAVLGYAFKKDTSDTRESPALECIKELLEDCPTEIAVFDPCCNTAIIRAEIGRLLGKEVLKEHGGTIEIYADAYQACANAHAAIIMTDCDEFRNSKASSTKQAPAVFPNVQKKAVSTDPRPFKRLEPSESEILALQKYMVSASSTSDPLQRFEHEPECEPGCDNCVREAVKVEPSIPVKSGEKLDWPRIAYHLQRPKWVFDGRGILNVAEMEGLGLRVESVGRKGWSGR